MIRAQDLGQEDPAGHTRDCPPRPATPRPRARPLVVSVPSAAAAAAATARIQRQAPGYSPSSFSISGQTEKTRLKFAASTFSVRETGGPETHGDPSSLTSKPEPRLRVSLFWGLCSEPNCAFGTRFCFSTGTA